MRPAIEWFMSDPVRIFVAFGVMLAAFGVFLVRLSFYEFEYHPTRRRKPIPDPWDRDHTGEFLVPPHMLAETPVTRSEARHRLEDTEGRTTNLAPYVRSMRARAMMPPPPPPPPGETRRSLRPDWRGEWIPDPEHTLIVNAPERVSDYSRLITIEEARDDAR